VKTLCLPKNENVPDDTTCVAAGWGLSKMLNFVSVMIDFIHYWTFLISFVQVLRSYEKLL